MNNKINKYRRRKQILFWLCVKLSYFVQFKLVHLPLWFYLSWYECWPYYAYLSYNQTLLGTSSDPQSEMLCLRYLKCQLAKSSPTMLQHQIWNMTVEKANNHTSKDYPTLTLLVIEVTFAHLYAINKVWYEYHYIYSDPEVDVGKDLPILFSCFCLEKRTLNNTFCAVSELMDTTYMKATPTSNIWHRVACLNNPCTAVYCLLALLTAGRDHTLILLYHPSIYHIHWLFWSLVF